MTEQREWNVKILAAILEGTKQPYSQAQIRSAFRSGSLIKRTTWEPILKRDVVVVKYEDLDLTAMGRKIQKIIDLQAETRDLAHKLRGFDVVNPEIAYEVGGFHDFYEETHETELATFTVKSESYGGGKDETGQYGHTRIVEVKQVEEKDVDWKWYEEGDDMRHSYYAPRWSTLTLIVYANNRDYVEKNPLYTNNIYGAVFSGETAPDGSAHEEDYVKREYARYRNSTWAAFSAAKDMAQEMLLGAHAVELAKQQEVMFVGFGRPQVWTS
jgi:hypothetical protein